MIERFRQYLSEIDSKLEKMFLKQAPFIKCKKGCAYCCKNGEYPLSELEYINLMFYFNELSEDLKTKIENNIKILIQKNNIKLYECPFLINNICSVYEARPLICRSFGLISFYKEEKNKVPFCVDIGLNYSDSYDKKANSLIKPAEDGTQPIAFNIDRRTLRNNEFETNYNILFGEDKALIDWLKEDFKI